MVLNIVGISTSFENIFLIASNVGISIKFSRQVMRKRPPTPETHAPAILCPHTAHSAISLRFFVRSSTAVGNGGKG